MAEGIQVETQTTGKMLVGNSGRTFLRSRGFWLKVFKMDKFMVGKYEDQGILWVETIKILRPLSFHISRHDGSRRRSWTIFDFFSVRLFWIFITYRCQFVSWFALFDSDSEVLKPQIKRVGDTVDCLEGQS